MPAPIRPAAHTPGPWKCTGGYTPTVVVGDTLLCVPSSPADEIGGRNLAELTANARLISAAPDLLAACIAANKKLAEYEAGTSGSRAKFEVEAAIAKATGTPL